MGGPELERIIREAFDLGYRAIDTATAYRNEESIGNVLQGLFNEGKVSREDVFVTSKLSPKEQGFENGYQAILESLKRLRLSYLDCMLIHWPGASKISPSDEKNRTLRIGTYKALERAYAEGLIRSFGVSNYLARHLDEIKEYATVMPMVLQMEIHPLYFPSWIATYQKEMDLVVTSYSTLGEGRFVNGQLPLTSVNDIATKRIASPSTVLLRWAIEKDLCVIPKTSNVSRLAENLGALTAFELTDEVSG